MIEKLKERGYRDYGHQFFKGAKLWQKRIGDLYLNVWCHPHLVGPTFEADCQIRDTVCGTVNLVFLDPEGRLEKIEAVLEKVKEVLGCEPMP